MPASQAGRRGFESLLPLHHFNNLHEIGLLQKPTFRGNGVGGCAEPLEKNRLEGLTSSVTGWHSQLSTAFRQGSDARERLLALSWNGCEKARLLGTDVDPSAPSQYRFAALHPGHGRRQ